MKCSKTQIITGCLVLWDHLLSTAQTYTWSNVRIGGGGLVSSVQAHPLVPNLRFITTDVGNPYRWNESTQRWEGFSLDFQSATYAKLTIAKSTVTATTYTEYTQSVVVPAGTTNFNIRSAKAGAAGTLYLDDFCLTVKPAGGGMARTANESPEHQ